MLDSLEKIAKIIALITIPILLWWLGTKYESADAKAKTAVEYVKLSVSIINNPNEVDPDILKWATDVFSEYSGIHLPSEVKEGIESGQITLSPVIDEEEWYTVVGSMETLAEAKELESQLNENRPVELAEYPFEIHLTKISKLYAVTIGGEISRSEAVARARIARTSNWVSDAFAERNRGWTQQ